MNRTPLQRKTPPTRSAWIKRSGRVRKLSPRQQRFNAQLNAMRPLVHARSGGLCEARLDGCHVAADHVHHRGGRKRPDANSLVLLLHVCWSCHVRLHRASAWSYNVGLLVHSWDTDPSPFVAPGPGRSEAHLTLSGCVAGPSSPSASPTGTKVLPEREAC